MCRVVLDEEVPAVVVVDVDALVLERRPVGFGEVSEDQFGELRIQEDVIQTFDGMLEHFGDESFDSAPDEEHAADVLRLAHDEMCGRGEVRRVRERHRFQPVQEHRVLVFAFTERDVLVARIDRPGLDDLGPGPEARPPTVVGPSLEGAATEDGRRQESRRWEKDHT